MASPFSSVYSSATFNLLHYSLHHSDSFSQFSYQPSQTLEWVTKLNIKARTHPRRRPDADLYGHHYIPPPPPGQVVQKPDKQLDGAATYSTQPTRRLMTLLLTSTAEFQKSRRDPIATSVPLVSHTYVPERAKIMCCWGSSLCCWGPSLFAKTWASVYHDRYTQRPLHVVKMPHSDAVTYDYRILKKELAVRSAVLKQDTGGLVVSITVYRNI
jgi:hypothetical protein